MGGSGTEDAPLGAISVSMEINSLGLGEGHRGAGAAEGSLGLNPGALQQSQAWEVRGDRRLAGGAAGQAGVRQGQGETPGRGSCAQCCRQVREMRL